eukprot:CAMPEP_0182497302 /NCGR_PEP_ID=MMETSP1321-20130603/5812_1 /TAXON_ID=91990 /ORGANISM="Bolidomonas sp., Strain RCC1657" /LENGTH=199 /DNA_ID=CAMNT_0024701141 /DNA_START=154 /DNA_END=753 /DNA_ORIENTATION=+
MYSLNIIMVVALLILCLHLGAVDGSRVSPRIEQQRIEKLMQELSEMEKSTIYAMHAQGLPTKDIATALNDKKTVDELNKIIKVLQSAHTDHLGRISDATVNKAPPAKRGSSAEKDGLQKSRKPTKKKQTTSSHAENVKLSNANRNKFKKKNGTDTNNNIHGHKRERIEKERERSKQMKKERRRANKIGVKGDGSRGIAI